MVDSKVECYYCDSNPMLDHRICINLYGNPVPTPTQYKVLRFADGMAALYVFVGPLFEHVETFVGISAAEKYVNDTCTGNYNLHVESTEQTCY